MDTPTTDDFCRTLSIAHNESIAGTAAHTTVWLVLEHTGTWGAKAVPESDLPAAVRERLMAWQAEIPGTRVQLIRRDKQAKRPRLMIGVSELPHPRLVQMELAGYEALLELDLPGSIAALRQGAEIPGAEALTRPVVLVCTNGKRDRCCAKWGVPVYQALQQQPELDVWQTTHLGGHRFAATLLTLPDGVCYGRVEPDEVPTLAAAITRGEMFDLARVRGRTCLSGAAQAAELHWRGHSGITAIGALISTEEQADGEATLVTLRDTADADHRYRVMRTTTDELARPSCGKDPAPIAAWAIEAEG